MPAAPPALDGKTFGPARGLQDDLVRGGQRGLRRPEPDLELPPGAVAPVDPAQPDEISLSR